MALERVKKAKHQVAEDMKHTSEQLHKALSRSHHGIHRESYGFAFRAAFIMHRASRQKIRFGNFWPFILAPCEAAEPSIWKGYC